MSKNPISDDPRVKRTRRMLLQAMLELIKERGFEGVTVRDIAAKAEVNRATFYLHFRDKYDLLEQSMEELLDEIALPPAGKTNVMAEEHAPDILVQWLRQITAYADLYQLIIVKNGVQNFARQLRTELEDFIAALFQNSGQPLVSKMRLAVHSRFVAAAYLGVVEWWLAANQPCPPEQLAEQLWQMTADGVIKSLTSPA